MCETFVFRSDCLYVSVVIFSPRVCGLVLITRTFTFFPSARENVMILSVQPSQGLDNIHQIVSLYVVVH